MAKNNPEETQIASTSSQIAERPSFLNPNDLRGTENITSNDIQMPRLALAQALSPQLEEGNAQYIEGLRLGQMFNGLTKKIYGKGPVLFVPIRSEKPRYIEFIPRNEGGGIRDYDVPHDDPRTQFTKDATGKSVAPVATKFYDFVIMLLDPANYRELLALSLKSTGLKVARQLNGFIASRNAPSFAGLYNLGTATAKNAKGTFGVFTVEQAGWVTEADYNHASSIYEGMKDKSLVVDREPDDPDSFDPEKLENPANM